MALNKKVGGVKWIGPWAASPGSVGFRRSLNAIKGDQRGDQRAIKERSKERSKGSALIVFKTNNAAPFYFAFILLLFCPFPSRLSRRTMALMSRREPLLVKQLSERGSGRGLISICAAGGIGVTANLER